MTIERDPLLEKLAAAEAPPLPERLAARTLLRATAHLARRPRREARGPLLRLPIPAFAVPALLGSAAVALAIDTCLQVARIFGGT
jgi:hypothetical protein